MKGLCKNELYNKQLKSCSWFCEVSLFYVASFVVLKGLQIDLVLLQEAMLRSGLTLHNPLRDYVLLKTAAALCLVYPRYLKPETTMVLAPYANQKHFRGQSERPCFSIGFWGLGRSSKS